MATLKLSFKTFFTFGIVLFFVFTFILSTSYKNQTSLYDGFEAEDPFLQRNVYIETKDQLNEIHALLKQLQFPNQNGQQVKEEPQNAVCKEKVRSVAFAKTHKTGSSTLQNIFLRYGVNHDLNFAFPPRSWMFKLTEPMDASLVLDGPWKSLDFHIFLSHSIWNYTEIRKILPNAKYVTLLRDPVTCFESNFVFMGLDKSLRMDINQYAQQFAAKNVKRRKNAYVGQNQLWWDLGVDAELLDDPENVKKYIDIFDKQFDLVLIIEQFDESLILMKDILCWDMEDIVYINQLERVQEKRNVIMTEETKQILKKWLWSDYMLYDHFKAKLERKIVEYGKEKIVTEAQDLKNRVISTKKECIKMKKEQRELSGDPKKGFAGVFAYIPDENKTWCNPYLRRETDFAYDIRRYQSLKVEHLEVLNGKRKPEA